MKSILFAMLLIVGIAVDSAPLSECPPPPNNKSVSECCDIPKPVTESLFGACKMAGGKESAAHSTTGIWECSFNQTTDGQIDMAALMKVAHEHNNGIEEWNAVTDHSITACVTQMNAMPAAATVPDHHYHHDRQHDQGCSAKFNSLMECIFMHSFVGCPAKVYKQSNDCDDLRKYAETCPIHKI